MRRKHNNLNSKAISHGRPYKDAAKPVMSAPTKARQRDKSSRADMTKNAIAKAANISPKVTAKVQEAFAIIP